MLGRSVVLLAAFGILVAAAPAAAQPASSAAGTVTYRPPVDEPVVDVFRPPATPYGPGNRGIDFATRSGEPVRASAAGRIVFAGPVGGSLHVVVLHADGLRSSYSFLQSILVREGDRVDAGQPVGTAARVLHVGFRAGDAYLDPAVLFGHGFHVRLVPVEERPALDAVRRDLADRLLSSRGGGVAGALKAGVRWARRGVGREVGSLRDELLTWAHYAHELDPRTHMFRVADTAWRWWRSRGHCTPATVDPPRPAGRRIAVLVGGLGSTSTNAAVTDVDTDTLGYAGPDVVQFSYAGGRTPDASDGFGAIPAHEYRRVDTEGDLDAAGRRLADLLRAVRAAAPGVPVDVIAHSQGGVVARVALDVAPPSAGAGGVLVTLGTPHHGADLATGAGALAHSTSGHAALVLASEVAPGPDAPSPAVGELSEISPLIRRLDKRGLPLGVRAVSIAARGDLVVPAGRSRLAGAENAVVDLAGPAAHDHLPGSAAAEREIALAIGGKPPTCESFADAMLDGVVSDGIGWFEDGVGAGLAAGARYVDRRMPGPQATATRTPGQP